MTPSRKLYTWHLRIGTQWAPLGTNEHASRFTNKWHFCCPKCGEVWMKCLPVDSPETWITFRSQVGPCCGTGAILSPRIHRECSLTGDLKVYPTAWLKLEFLRMMGDNVDLFDHNISPIRNLLS